jgi:hypothetical protein
MGEMLSQRSWQSIEEPRHLWLTSVPAWSKIRYLIPNLARVVDMIRRPAPGICSAGDFRCKRLKKARIAPLAGSFKQEKEGRQVLELSTFLATEAK